MDGGAEIRLFDPHRDPRDWTDLLGPTDSAVFVKSRTTLVSLDANGKPFPNPDDTTCLVFRSVDAARQFCESTVEALPHVRCEVYDSQGLAHPPLLVVVHPSFHQEEESGSRSSRLRRLIAGALLLASAPLLWMGVHWPNDLTPYLAFTCILFGLRFLQWDFGLKHREAERRKHLEAHLKKERGDA